MTLFKKITALMIAIPLIALPASSFAAGETEGAPKTTEDKDVKKPDDEKTAEDKPAIKCIGDQIFDKGLKKCVAEEESSSLDQDSIYTYGRDLARAGQYENAIRVLYLTHDQNDPRVLNYLGYSNRKLGNMEVALGYYRAAVAANPDFSLVREYLGEAYIQLGQLEKAREQLTQIERICGNQTCREYAMLSKYMVTSQLK